MPRVRNDSGEKIPAFAPMRVTGVVEVKKQLVFKVEQQDTSDGPVLINGMTPIADGKYGDAQEGPIVAAYFDTTDAPAVGDELGAEDASWKLGADGSGWIFLGSLGSDAIGMFRQAGGGGCGFFKSLDTRVEGTNQLFGVNESDECVMFDVGPCSTESTTTTPAPTTTTGSP